MWQEIHQSQQISSDKFYWYYAYKTHTSFKKKIKRYVCEPIINQPTQRQDSSCNYIICLSTVTVALNENLL